MSMFNKFLASLGMGSARVDTKLEKDSFYPGDQVKGVVEITGGNVEQQIDEIYLTIHTKYEKESGDKKYHETATIERIRINEPFSIAANEVKDIPFSFTLPLDTPLTYGVTKVWIATGLDIKNAVDPKDEDYIKVTPTPLIHSAFLALTDLGFKLRSAKCEQAPYKFRKRMPYIQEFEFVPTSGQFRGLLDELEFVFYQVNTDRAEVLLEVDRKARGLAGLFAEALDVDETMVRLDLSKQDVPYMKEKLTQVISRYS
ncbi:sporulation protein [Bacillus massiliigorillae]|uniref:sporulation protein n=1 Tax=Bacillus massiliigorillae TaxID=1243664 RepID=UPI0003A71177|nr:sporulation protein [Bacillus massiliigorillae]